MFSLSTAYWILSLYNDVHITTASFVQISLDDTASTHALQQTVPMMSALVLLNYVLTDGVVVWRAWVICQDGYRRSLILPLGFLCLTLSEFWFFYAPAGFLLMVGMTIVSVLVTIGLRVAITVLNNTQQIVVVHRGIALVLDYLQVANLVLSLLTNIFSTSIIGIKAWHHRHWVTSELQLKRKNITTAERILALLVESGIIYCFSGAMVLIATLIQLPDGTLGDVYTPVHVQFAGIYPAIVLLLVSHRGELNQTVMFTSQGQNNAPNVSNLGTIEFGNNPHVNNSSGETETFADVAHNGSMVSHYS
ncbi:uncharacterized protein ARMOST_05752 [Armillaria ostoyae]|uniref:Uncharacterized protein n=1 Tax=Armillaria ostoyae TaxID=47428 RepID=A0A284R155_ARMOS|nr:uncharacterized protein ARMOST_05752 [Armillaria ostoyae]